MFALFLSCSGLFFFCHCRSFFFSSVIAGLDPAIEEIPGSCCACPGMTEEKNIVIPVLDTGIQKIQGTNLRYAHRKQRVSIKVRTAAGVAVKLATACHIQPFFYVMFGLEPDISFLDCRIKSDNDSIIFFCHPRTSAARSGDLWIFGSHAQRDATVGCPGQART